MSELKESRLKIQQLDKEMAGLFEQRMREVENILAYKVRNGLPILDAEQEARVIANNIANLTDPTLQEYYVLFLHHVMELSKAYQSRMMEGMKVAYCGVPGAFAHLAALKLFPEARMVAYPDFTAAYKACEAGEVDTAILPIENSYAGDVGRVMDLTFGGSLYINRMVELDVAQNLLAVKGSSLGSIKKVVSHPQALAQCATYIKEHSWEEVEYSNTATAAQYVAELNDPTVAAIASEETAHLYGLEVLQSNIHSSNDNTTRFAVFSKSNQALQTEDAGDHFILVFTVHNEAGALAKILNIIGSHGFNMSSLHSRPLTGMIWKHYFFAELEGNANSSEGKDLLRQLNTVCDKLKIIGTYRNVSL